MVAASWATIYHTEASPTAQQMSVLGIDMAKMVFHVVGMDQTGHVVLRKRIARSELLHFIAILPPLRMGMEACGSTHYRARRFRAHGHDVRLIAPQFVKAYVKPPKHDARDAEAICEAVIRPTMRFVPIKQVEHQDLQALHRVRERLIETRTALVNEIRGLLSEYGIVLPQGLTKFRTAVVRQLEDGQAKLTLLSTAVFWQLYDEYLALEQWVAYYHEKLTALARASGVPTHLYRLIPRKQVNGAVNQAPCVEDEPERDAGVLPTMSSFLVLQGRASRCWPGDSPPSCQP
jgi:transposase